MVRKCVLFAILSVSVFFFCGLGSAFAQAGEDLLFNEYVRNEATYLSQGITFPRSSFDEPLTLRRQLSELVGEQEYTSAVVVQQWEGGSMSERYDNPQQLLDMDPVFLCCDKEGEVLKFKHPDITATVLLDYREENTGKERSLVLHFNPRGFPDKVVFTRTSIMIAPGGEDDMRNFNSGSAGISASYLTAFDVADNKERWERFGKVLLSTVHKDTTGAALDATEQSCKKGLKEFEELENGLIYGQRLAADQRYYDSYVALSYMLEPLKQRMRPDTVTVDDAYYSLCEAMGGSAWIMGNFDTAEYYFGLIEDMRDSLSYDMNQFRESRKLAPALMDGAGTYIGQVLPVFFDIHKEHILEGVVESDGKITRITGKDELWKYNLKDLCTGGVSKMVISYTRSVEQMFMEGVLDQSTLCNFNNLIITVEKVSETLCRVNVLQPNFKRFDYKRFPDSEMNEPLVKSFLISKLPLVPVNPAGKVMGIKDIQDKLVYAYTLRDARRSFEAATVLMQLCREMEKLPQKQLEKEKNVELQAFVLYEAGSMLADVNMMNKAITYLRRSTQMYPTYITNSEYIAILSNIMDPRTFHIVVSQLNEIKDLPGPKNQELAEYESLLNRRLAFMLIEYKAYNQAEEILTALLKDPQSAEFATRELEYIKQMKEGK